MLDWFSYKGVIGRKTFVIRILAIWIVCASIFYLVSDVIELGLGIETYLFSKSIVEFLIIVLCTPTITKRLNDINWSLYLLGIFVLAGVLSIRNYILFGLYADKDSFISVITLLPGIAIGIAAIFLMLVLMFKKGCLGYEEAIQP